MAMLLRKLMKKENRCYTEFCLSGKKVKVKISLCLIKYHAIKTYFGSGGIAPCILDLRTSRM